MSSPRTSDRLVDRPSVLEAERADIIRDLERYLALLTSDSATPIVQEIASTLAHDGLQHLHDLDSADELREFAMRPNKETRR
jgi:hypothetical protein